MDTRHSLNDKPSSPGHAPRHFSMLREFHLADFFTLGNAACGMGAVILALSYMATGELAQYFGAVALAPAALFLEVLDGRIARARQEHSALGRELVSLNYADPMSSPLWTSRPEALGHTGYFAELIDEWAQESDPSETLFRLGCSVVDALGSGVAVEPLARYFEYWLLRLEGVYPALDRCPRCGRPMRFPDTPAPHT